MTASGNYGGDIFFTKIDRNSNWAWIKKFGTDLSDNGSKIAVDKKGNVYVGGYFGNHGGTGSVKRTISFDTMQKTSIGNADMFVTKCDSSRKVLWARAGGNQFNDYLTGLAIDTVGNLYIAGAIEPLSATFNQLQLQPFKTGNLSSNIFIVRYGDSGDIQWGKIIGAYGSATSNGSSLEPGSLAVHRSGHVYLTGTYCNCTARLHDGSLLANSNSDCNLFLAKYNAAGNVIGKRQAGGGGDEYSHAVTVDSLENA